MNTKAILITYDMIVYYILYIKLTKGGVWTFLGYGGLGDCCGLNLTVFFCWGWYAGGGINWFCAWWLLPVGEP